MEPTPGEYPSKMRVALVRRNPADGAAPLGLKKSLTSKSLQPYPFTPLSLTLQSLPPVAREHPAAGPADRTPPATSAGPARDRTATARRRPARAGDRPHGPDRTPGAHAARPRGQRTAPRPRPHAAGPARRLLPRPPRTRASSAWEPVSWPPAAPFHRSSPSTGPSIVQGKSTVVSCRSMLDCSSLFMCERCLM